MEKTKYSTISSLLVSIAFFILGALMFTSEDIIVELVSKIFGGIIACVGLFNLLLYIRRKNHQLPVNRLDSIVGIVMIVVGLLFIFLAGAFATAVRFLMGAWILLSGINKLIASLTIGPKYKNYTSMLLLSLVLIFIGAYIILRANLVIKGIGLVIMLYSAIEIAGYIVYKLSDINQPNKEDDNHIIIPEKTNKKEKKKFKEAKEVKEK